MTKEEVSEPRRRAPHPCSYCGRSYELPRPRACCSRGREWDIKIIAVQQASGEHMSEREVLPSNLVSRLRELHAKVVRGEPALIGSALQDAANALEHAETAVATGWEPIATAPKTGRTLLLGYLNSAGNWRTLRGQWFEEATMDEWDGDDGNNPAGWYETAVELDDPPNCWSTEPTHWMPLPKPPGSPVETAGVDRELHNIDDVVELRKLRASLRSAILMVEKLKVFGNDNVQRYDVAPWLVKVRAVLGPHAHETPYSSSQETPAKSHGLECGDCGSHSIIEVEIEPEVETSEPFCEKCQGWHKPCPPEKSSGNCPTGDWPHEAAKQMTTTGTPKGHCVYCGRAVNGSDPTKVTK